MNLIICSRTSAISAKSIKLLVVLSVLMICSCYAPPDLILVNGKIFTSDTAALYAEALAIKDNRIVAVGNTAEVQSLAGKKTRQIDLEGLLVVPGFNDAHNHLPDGLDAVHIAFDNMDPSWQAFTDTLKQVVGQTPDGKWIEVIIGPSVASAPTANRFELDKISVTHPIRLMSWWGHVTVSNTIGMDKMGIPIMQKDSKSGFYERIDNSDTLTGKAFEKNAYNPHTSYAQFASIRNENAFVKELKDISGELLRMGVASYQSMCRYTPERKNDDVIKAF